MPPPIRARRPGGGSVAVICAPHQPPQWAAAPGDVGRSPGGYRRCPAPPGAPPTLPGMARSATRRPAAAAPATGEVNPQAPCPCGSGRRYKHCHGSGYAPPVRRPFEGLTGEADWVALRELVPAATATLRTTTGKEVTLASVLPGGTPALVRTNGEILVGVQTQTASDDVSRDIGTALAAALEAPKGAPVDPA